MRRICRLARDQRGATAVEYGLILALIFMAILGSVQLFAGQVVGVMNSVSSRVVNAGEH